MLQFCVMCGPLSWYILPYLCGRRFQFSHGSDRLQLTLVLWKVRRINIDCIEECFLYQHTNGSTRYRSEDMPSQLGLMFTMNRCLLWSISRHCRTTTRTLNFNFNCYSRQKFNYTSGNYADARREFLGGFLSQLMVVCSRYGTLLEIELFVYAMITFLLSVLKDRSGSRTIPMRKGVLYLIMEKAMCHMFKVARQHAMHLVRKSGTPSLGKQHGFETLQISPNSKYNPSVFWMFARDRLRTRIGGGSNTV